MPVPHPFGGDAKVDQFPPLGETIGTTEAEPASTPLMGETSMPGPGEEEDE